MSGTAIARSQGGYLQRPSPTGLAEVVDLILDKGLVIDIYVRVSLVGIEVLTIDARIVVASVDTYLRFAEAVNRLDLAASSDSKNLPELVDDVTSSGAKSKTKGALEGAKSTLSDIFDGDEEDEDEGDEEEEERPRRRRRQSSSSRSRSDGGERRTRRRRRSSREEE